MPYIGQPPVSGDTTKSFRLLDNLASFTLTFDATSSSVVDTSANTLTFANHRFVTAQRVTYSDGGGTAIGGLTDGTAYFIIKVDPNTIQLASSASNANNGTAISLSSGAAGGSHTLNIAFDGTNTKFKATYGNGTKAKISRAGQLLISINGVLQQAQESSTPTLGFGLDSDSTIVFSQAPVSTDVLFGQILADTITNFDTQDNTLDVFTGDGSTVNFNLSKKPASNNDILVTLDGVVQYPTTTSTSNAYSVTESTLTFTAAPADGVAIQVRHIGFAGATSSAVTGLYGRTGNVTLSSSDDDITVGNVTAGIITATSYGSISGTTASFSGNVSIGGTLTYEDVTNIDAVGLITARSGVKFGASGTTVQGTSTGIGVGLASPNSRLHVKGGSESTDNLLLTLQSDGVANDGSLSTGLRLINSTSDSSTHGGEVRAIRSSASAAALTFSTYNGSSIAEGLRIDSSGRLLIGTTSAVDSGATSSLQVVNTSTSILALGRNDSSISAGNDLGAIRFYGNAGGSYQQCAQIIAEADGTHANNDKPSRLVFATTADGGSSSTERMRIDSSGKMGLGTDSPARGPLHINSSTADTYFHVTNSTTGSSASDGFTLHQSGNETLLNNRESGNMRFYTAGSEQMRIDSSGRLLLGTTTEGVSGGDQLTIAASAHSGMTVRAGTSSRSSIYMSDGTSGADEYRGYIEYDHASNYMRFGTDASERLRIDSSGDVMIGTTSNTAHSDADNLIVGSTGGTHQGMTINGSTSSQIRFADSGSNTAGYIIYSHSADDLQFATNGSEGMRLMSTGRLGLGMTAPAGRLHVSENSTSLPGAYIDAPSGSYSSDVQFLRCGRGNNSAFTFLACVSAYTGSPDNEFILRGDGNGYADDTWHGGGADYAEYFEWSDGNTEAEDRRGISVVLDGDKIREAVTGEEPIGVISGSPSVVGDTDIARWKHKYLRDDFGTYVRDEEGERQLNPDYDPDTEYVSREDRPEWDTVGLMGKLRIRKGQVTGTRWIKMRDVSDTVEEWLVR